MGMFGGIGKSLGGLVGGLTGQGGADAAKDAAAAQIAALTKAIEEYRSGYAGQQTLFNPYAQAGTAGLDNLNKLNMGDFSAFENSPDYLYAREQALDAVDAQKAAGGGFFSGARGTALAKTASGLASQNLGNYRNALGQQIGYGQYGTTGLSNALTNMTQGIADARIGAGNARAGGAIGAANSYAGAAGNLLSFASSFMGGGGMGMSQPQSGYGTPQVTSNTGGLGPWMGSTGGSLFG